MCNFRGLWGFYGGRKKKFVVRIFKEDKNLSRGLVGYSDFIKKDFRIIFFMGKNLL